MMRITRIINSTLKGLAEEIEQNLSRLEKLMGAKLGDPANPLLVSVRSGATASMPGMMDTVLNLGLNPDAIKGLIKKRATNALRGMYTGVLSPCLVTSL